MFVIELWQEHPETLVGSQARAFWWKGSTSYSLSCKGGYG